MVTRIAMPYWILIVPVDEQKAKSSQKLSDSKN